MCVCTIFSPSQQGCPWRLPVRKWIWCKAHLVREGGVQGAGGVLGTDAASCSPEAALVAVLTPERSCILTSLQGFGFSEETFLSWAVPPGYTVTACFLVPEPPSLPPTHTPPHLRTTPGQLLTLSAQAAQGCSVCLPSASFPPGCSTSQALKGEQIRTGWGSVRSPETFLCLLRRSSA